MLNSQTKDINKKESPPEKGSAQAPAIQLPKGGGAIRGIGEKFAANPVTGTGSMTVPIATSSGRSGFGPQLSLSYDSGAGNGPFGFGWSLSLPSITRKTDKGLPKYQDAEESDVFILSGAEDLVPVYRQDPDGSWVASHPGYQRDPDGFWVRDHEGRLVIYEDELNGYRVRRYRPRIEGLFARIERWQDKQTGDVHWRSISKDNITTYYGKTPQARIVDPRDNSRIFQWLIEESHDDKGNIIHYVYKKENQQQISQSLVSEKNRLANNIGFTNQYLKRIKYGNKTPNNTDFLFEVVFDYGEHNYEVIQANNNGEQVERVKCSIDELAEWQCRPDPFSTYRAGFEIRTYRLCQRVLMFHRFPELGVNPCLVRSTDFVYAHNWISCYSYMTSITQTGYVWDNLTTDYLFKSLPPVEFDYSFAIPQQEVLSIDPESIENLPVGIDGSLYQWIDLDGEGISGILTEQADAWFYKPNLGNGRLAPTLLVTKKPSISDLQGGQQQFLDLAGDGKLDLVVLSDRITGFYERNDDADWDSFRPFTLEPNINWKDPNLRFIDLNGDGHADVLITENEVFTWYPSRAEEGFDYSETARKQYDEEKGPTLVFAEATQSVYLADMSGDGLTDIVRIRNGEVCYWPNLGYGQFGAKVTMDNAPWFDAPDLFDQRRIRLADIDGTGTTDIIYLGSNSITCWFNQSGNSWHNNPFTIEAFPKTDNLSNIMVTDLLGKGTASIVWSSPLPGNSHRPMQYLDLMGEKPHLLISVKNNLGAETKVHYAASTKFYLEDKRAKKSWITRIPFPIHVVERVEASDHVSRNRFVTRYAYHHGYFDGGEREFRGFGMVEQRDTEEFATLSAGDSLAPLVGEGLGEGASNIDAASHVPPVLTRTWFHTGAYLENSRISRLFEDEYYHEGDTSLGEEGLTDAQLKVMLLDDTILPPELSAEETREACRSLKGSILRQEVYALDRQPDGTLTEESDRPYTVSERNYTIKRLQPKAENKHAVFFTHARETIDFHYERKLYDIAGKKRADPRVTHNITLEVDDYGNVLKSTAIGYGRRYDDPNPLLSSDDKKKQKRTLITYTENEFTNEIDLADDYRAPLPCESLTYELLKIKPNANQPNVTNLFRFEEMDGYIQTVSDGNHDLPYENWDADEDALPALRRRLIEHIRTLYRKNDLTGFLLLGTVEPLALPGESYKLSFTPGLLGEVYKRKKPDNTIEDLLPNPTTVLAGEGGYKSSQDLRNQGVFPSNNTHPLWTESDADDHWWIPSGKQAFDPAHFYLPIEFIDPFGNKTTITYEAPYYLLLKKTEDPLHNIVETKNDYRVLQPNLVTDPNGNRTEVAFDALGLVTGTAVMGKENEPDGRKKGDLLDGFEPDLTQAQIDAFLAEPREPGADPSESVATQIVHDLLGQASTRIVYDLDRFKRLGKPPFAATISRETHVSDLADGERSKLQVSFSYSDGFGREIQKKIQAEPLVEGGPNVNPRWVGSGWTIFNNKGKPVRQYEPFFDDTHDFKFGNQVGVSPILFYDPVERVVATLHPNHTWEKVVFDPWQQTTYDVNDTVAASGTETGDPRTDKDIKGYVREYFKKQPATWQTWHVQRQGGALGAQEQAAATKAAAHTNTPTTTYFDTLGRTFLTIAHNRFERNNAIVEEKYPIRVELDIEGNQREVKDERKKPDSTLEQRVVMRYDYDMLSNKIKQTSMDAGIRWMLNDVTGKPIRTWDSRNHEFNYKYDELRRPVEMRVKGGEGNVPLNNLYEKIIYGENKSLNGNTDRELNLRGKPFEHYDTAGKIRFEEYDFKGNLLKNQRWLTGDDHYKKVVNWDIANRDSLLERNESFITETTYDALNRVIQNKTPDGSITRPTYNEANLLEIVEVEQNGTTNQFVKDINYNEKGQRRDVTYGNNIKTTYAYDKETFRLLHLQTKKANGKLLQDLYYTYDPVGNICQIEDKAIPTVFFNNFVIEPINRYTYDAIYRLIKAEGKEHIAQVSFGLQDNWNDLPFLKQYSVNDPMTWRNYTQQYQYDEVGNIKQIDHKANGGDWTRDYDYETVNNRLKSTTVDGHTYEYRHHPQHGFMDIMPHLPVMKWDFKDQLQATTQQVVTGNAIPEMTYYVYDSAGQRVRKITESHLTAAEVAAGKKPKRMKERIYLSGFEIYREFNDTPSAGSGQAIKLERETLHIMDDKQRIAMVETEIPDPQSPTPNPQSLIRYQFSNHLGTACLEMDDDENNPRIISFEEYHPYGTTSYQAVNKDIKAAAKRYRYTGKERDEESGLYYHGARYYADWLGRWTAADPAGLVDGSNIYAYAGNNPVRHTDSTGKQCDPTNASCIDPTVASSSSPFVSGGLSATGNLMSSFAPASSASAATSVAAQTSNSIDDLLTFIHAQAGFETGALRPPTFNPRSASPFGTAAHGQATDVVQELQRLGFYDAERIYSEVRTVNGVVTQMGGTPGGPRGALNMDIVVARPGTTIAVGNNLSGGTAEMIGDLKYGGGVIDPKYGALGSPLETITGRTTAGPLPAFPEVVAPGMTSSARFLAAGGGALNAAGGVFMLASIDPEHDPAIVTAGKATSGGASLVGGGMMVGGALAGDAGLVALGGAASGVGMVVAAPIMAYEMRPRGIVAIDPELRDRAIQRYRNGENVNPFCAQCHGPGGALDPNNDWNAGGSRRAAFVRRLQFVDLGK